MEFLPLSKRSSDARQNAYDGFGEQSNNLNVGSRGMLDVSIKPKSRSIEAAVEAIFYVKKQEESRDKKRLKKRFRAATSENINMDLLELDSLLDNMETETGNHLNQWDMSSFDFNLTENSEWDQYIQVPSSENSSLESQEIIPDIGIIEQNQELPQENSGMKWSSSCTNLPSILSFGNPGSPIELQAVPVVRKDPKRKRTARSRAEFANREHVIAERKRRERVSENLFTLSGLIPGLKKRDKASVLTKTIEYMKQMQEKLKTLEEQIAAKDPNIEAEHTSKRSKLVSVSSTDNKSPKIELNVSGNTYLIKIHCTEASKGTLVKALNVAESLHLKVVTANLTQFSEQMLDITITSQVEEGFQVTMNDLFKKLKTALE